VRFVKMMLMLFVASNAFSQTTFVGVDSILKNYNEDEYISFIVSILVKELQRDNINLCTAKHITKRSTKNIGFNVLLIPQILFEYDKINNNKISVFFDSINPINRAIIYKKNKYFGSLLSTEHDNTFFCPRLRKMSGYTNLNCGKYIYRENEYSKSLKRLLKKEPFLVFKEPSFERVWFYIDKNRKPFVFTYDSECYELEYFFSNKNLLKYSMPIPFAKPIKN